MVVDTQPPEPGADEADYIKINAGIFEAKLSLGAFRRKLANVTGAAQHQEAAKALSEMIDETLESYRTMVKVLSPLYEITTTRQLMDRFPPIYSEFMSMYLNDANNVRTRCGIVTAKLEELGKKKAWMRRLPGGRASFEQLKSFTEKWVGDDANLQNTMYSFLWGVNTVLSDVHRKLPKSPAKALAAMRAFLDFVDSEFQIVRREVSDLQVLSTKL